MIPAEDTSSSKTCTECGRVFTKAAHLLRHVRSHAREKPFSCSVCRKAFARTDALQRHERTVHCPKRRKTGQGSGSSDGDVDMVTEQPAEMLYQPVEGAETLVQPSMFDMPLASSSSEAISFDGMQSLFSTPSFLAAFPSSAIPSSEAQVDEMILEWLGQGGGAFTTQQALANAVGLQDQDFGFDLLHPAEGQILQPRVQPAVNPIPDAESLFRDSATGCGLVRPIESPTVTRPAEPAPVMCASVARLPERPRFLRASRSVVVEDTWESGLSGRKSNPVSRPDSPQPSKITSPEQFVNELHVEGPDASTTHAPNAVIPSLKFLDACLHLYFRDFHPSFPIIHKPTFHRDRTSPLLLLSMCSIGCMFVGTQAARESGLWIYRRVHVVTVLTRDSRLKQVETRLPVLISALLGQCFSFLHGLPAQMLTAESFHGCLCAMARRSGLFKEVKPNPISYDLVADLDGAELEKRWREWGRQETFRRIGLGLTIHGAELTAFSGIAQGICAQTAGENSFNDSVFEAEDAETWRSLMKCVAEDEVLSDPPNTFLPTVLLSQSVVQVHMLRDFERTALVDDPPLRLLAGFYTYMTKLATRHNFLHVIQQPQDTRVSSSQRSLAVLWHYNCLVRLAPISQIEVAAGRVGPVADAGSVPAWVNTPPARLAALHCGSILYHAADLKDQGFLVPRAIFQATLVLLSYLSFTQPSSEIVDVAQISDWHTLVSLCDHGSTPGGVQTAEERFVANGGSISVKGFMDGKERQMDIVSLRSSTNRLVRRCTPWGIGDTLGDILSDISF